MNDAPTGPEPTPAPPPPLPVLRGGGAENYPASPEYLLSARNPRGRVVTECVEAHSGDAAVEALRGRGYSDIVLHTDDAAAVYTRYGKVAKRISPRDYVTLLRRRSLLDRVLFTTRKTYAAGWWVYTLLAAFFALLRATGQPWGSWGYLAAVYLAYPPVFALGAQLLSPAQRYHRLLEAGGWGRWDEVLRLALALAAKLPPVDLAFREAQALAGLGRLDEALERVRPFADDFHPPAWLFQAFLGDVYLAARQPDEHLACLERALELAPNNPTVLLDAALSRLRYQREAAAAGARSLIERAETHAISDGLAPFVDHAEGVRALEQSDADQARRRLEEALRKFRALRSSNPLLGAVEDRVHAYLALACAAQGDQSAAAEHFRCAEPRLRALAMGDLIVRCRAALTGPPPDREISS